MPQKAVFFDRDGVLNYAVLRGGQNLPPANLAQLAMPNDAMVALKRLKQAGYLLLGVTNQPDVARGKTAKSCVLEINQYLQVTLALDAIFVCFHDDKDACACRKPKPGMLIAAAKAYDLDLPESYMIGDRDKDILAGQKAGCKTIWMRYDQSLSPVSGADFNATSLTIATNWILSE